MSEKSNLRHRMREIFSQHQTCTIAPMKWRSQWVRENEKPTDEDWDDHEDWRPGWDGEDAVAFIAEQYLDSDPDYGDPAFWDDGRMWVEDPSGAVKAFSIILDYAPKFAVWEE